LPIDASREEISGGLLETAVDTSLRFDDAKALPKPQQHQQQIAA
jgi:hypothetical protein